MSLQIGIICIFIIRRLIYDKIVVFFVVWFILMVTVDYNQTDLKYAAGRMFCNRREVL